MSSLSLLAGRTVVCFSQPMCLFSGKVSYGTHAATQQAEPSKPSVATEIPGPRSKQLLKELDNIQVLGIGQDKHNFSA